MEEPAISSGTGSHASDLSYLVRISCAPPTRTPAGRGLGGGKTKRMFEAIAYTCPIGPTAGDQMPPPTQGKANSPTSAVAFMEWSASVVATKAWVRDAAARATVWPVTDVCAT